MTLRSSGSPFAVLRARMPVSTWITTSLALLLASTALACAGDQQAETLDTAQAAAARPQPVTADSADPRMAAADSARILGSDTASVWVIEVSDFQCPFCRVWHENTFDEFREEFIDSGRIRFAYVNMPLRMHQHAREAAHYAMCAGAQGRFFEYSEQLFATQPTWSEQPSPTATFDSLAAPAGVDQAELSRCVADGVMEPLVDADYQRAVQTGVGSTPSFIIGNQRLEGVQSMDGLRNAIDAATAAAASGTR